MLEWKVYYHDFNGKKIVPYNIFAHGGFLENCKKNAKKNAKDEYLFREQLKRDLMYYFWARCEWEIVLKPLTGIAADEKIDVYDQVMLNWDAFCKYVWDHGVELRRKEKKSGNRQHERV